MEVALVTLQPENLSAELVQNFGAGGGGGETAT